MLAGPVQLGPGIREVTGGQEKLQGEELACTRKQVILLSKGSVIQAGEAAGAKVPGPHTHAPWRSEGAGAGARLPCISDFNSN